MDVSKCSIGKLAMQSIVVSLPTAHINKTYNFVACANPHKPAKVTCETLLTFYLLQSLS